MFITVILHIRAALNIYSFNNQIEGPEFMEDQ